jgi:hypothetical protein
VTDTCRNLTSKTIDVLVSFCQDQGRPALPHGFNNVVTYAAIPDVVIDELVIKSMKLDSLV